MAERIEEFINENDDELSGKDWIENEQKHVWRFVWPSFKCVLKKMYKKNS